MGLQHRRWTLSHCRLHFVNIPTPLELFNRLNVSQNVLEEPPKHLDANKLRFVNTLSALSSENYLGTWDSSWLQLMQKKIHPCYKPFSLLFVFFWLEVLLKTANQNTANCKHCSSANQKKKPQPGFWTHDPTSKCIVPPLITCKNLIWANRLTNMGLPQCKNLTGFSSCYWLLFSFPVLFYRSCFLCFTSTVSCTGSYTEVKPQILATINYKNHATRPNVISRWRDIRKKQNYSPVLSNFCVISS